MKTTKEKIKVMQAYEDGKVVEVANRNKEDWEKFSVENPTWNWLECDYRIKEENELWIVVWKNGSTSIYKTAPICLKYKSVEMVFKAIECSEDGYNELAKKEQPRMSKIGRMYLSELCEEYKYINSDLTKGKYFELEILIDNRQKEPEYRAFENLNELAPYTNWWFRDKAVYKDIRRIVEININNETIWLFGGREWYKMPSLFFKCEMSPDGINNWQPCGVKK